MRTSSKVLLAVVAVAAVVLIVLSLRHKPLSPQAQITAQIDSAVTAANRHNAGGVMTIISEHYRDDNGFNTDAVHALLVRSMKGQPTERVSMPNSVITVQGDTATSTGFLTVQDTQSGSTLYSHEVTLQWQKEPSRSFLIFPTDVWRVVGASYGSIGDSDTGI
jgi:hypothetical protein